MKTMVRQIVLGMYFVLAVSAGNTYATTFGESCSTLPITDNTGYLNDDTAYGYIRKSLDMKTYVTDGCAIGEEFKFCIKNQVGSANACKQVRMKIGSYAKLKTLSSNPNIGGHPILGEISVGVRIIDEVACLVMPTSRGSMPLMCRDTTIAPAVAEETLDAICKNIDKSCYSANTKTQSLLSFSGVTVNCLKDTLDKILYIGSECPITEKNSLNAIQSFADFQENMKMAVRGALILYVMIYGFKLVMNKEYADLDKIALFVIKFLFVVYFSVGLGTKILKNGQEVSHNGMTELALPIFAELTSNFAEIVFLSGGSQGLCAFDPDKYESGYSYYRIWDAIDCRVGYYLGMQILYNIGSIVDSMSADSNPVGRPIDGGVNNSNAYSVLKKAGAFSFFAVMFGFFLAGNILIVMLGLVFVVVFLSVIMYFITIYLICLITLYAMAYVSPIFVPMLLFERTKGYFDSWLKVVISCILQPAIIAGFIALLLTMYDSAIYGNCEFQRHDYTSGEFAFSTFELRLPDAEEEKCKSSFGYMLLAYYKGAGWEANNMMLFTVYSLKDTLNILPSLIYVVIYVIIFYFFIQSASEFASDLSGGPNLKDVTASPTSIMDKAMAMASNMSAKKSGGAGGADLKAGQRRSSDKLSGGGKSSGESKSSDKASVGSESKSKSG